MALKQVDVAYYTYLEKTTESNSEGKMAHLTDLCVKLIKFIRLNCLTFWIGAGELTHLLKDVLIQFSARKILSNYIQFLF